MKAVLCQSPVPIAADVPPSARFQPLPLHTTLPGRSSVKYDAVIVGASIAGLSSALHLARAGWSVIVIDRRREIGTPVRCGEATGNRAELSRFVTIDESWIACDINGLVAHVNNSFSRMLPVREGGVMLHRDRFELACAHSAEGKGAKILLNTPVTGLFREKGCPAGVTLENGDRIEALCIIGADGAESSIGRWAGITGPLLLTEIASALQYRLKSDFCNDGLLHFFIGGSVIPHGYIWVFPKGNGMVSIGGGLYRYSPEYPRVQYFVDRFLQKHLGIEPPRETLVSGAIPVTLPPRRLSKGNIVLVGDAARQPNPLTAGGIMNALEAAESASRWLIRCRKANGVTIPDTYSAGWRQNQRRQHKLFMLLREIWFSTPEAKMIPCLETVFLLTGAGIDRSKPFKLPILPLIRFLFLVFPITVKHLRILFK